MQASQGGATVRINHKIAAISDPNGFSAHRHPSGNNTHETNDLFLFVFVDKRGKGLVEPRVLKEEFLKIGSEGWRRRQLAIMQDPPVQIRYLRDVVLDKWAYSTQFS